MLLFLRSVLLHLWAMTASSQNTLQLEADLYSSAASNTYELQVTFHSIVVNCLSDERGEHCTTLTDCL